MSEIRPSDFSLRSKCPAGGGFVKEPTTRDRLPHGQVLTKKWPVLTYGETPSVDLETWTFRCFGLIETPASWTWRSF